MSPRPTAARTVPSAGIALALAAGTISALGAPAAANTPQLPQSPNTDGATALTPVLKAGQATSLTRHIEPSSEPAPEMTHRVAAGETVSHIALRAGVSISSIIEANSLDSEAFIKAGQALRIPAPGTKASSTASSSTGPRNHTVAAGETVSGLAKRYDTSVGDIISANSLGADGLIMIGQQLRILGSGSGSTTTGGGASSSGGSAPDTASHTVAAGETVSGLAKRYDTSVGDIISANSLGADGLIMIGQQLRIPGSGDDSALNNEPEQVSDSFAGRTYTADVVGAANENKDTLLSMEVPSQAQMQQTVRQVAGEMGVDASLAMAVAQQESGFDAQAVSPANAVGVMQVIPSSGQWASELVGRELNLLDPHDNVVAGVAILRQLEATAADRDHAIAGYYQGLAGVQDNGMYEDTEAYVANVSSLMQRY